MRILKRLHNNSIIEIILTYANSNQHLPFSESCTINFQPNVIILFCKNGSRDREKRALQILRGEK